MNAEIIAVGSELLLGQIANTNAQFLSENLALLGINVYYHSVVGDNPQRLKEVVVSAQKRADLIIFTGGLGPTKDDLTKETISELLGKRLVYDKEALDSILAYYQSTGKVMTENNRKQALILEDCHVLPNRNGMAPGMIAEADNRHYILLPGPPSEMKPMFLNFAQPFLLDQSSEPLVSRVLRYFGIGESTLETEIMDLIDSQSNPTIAPLAKESEVTLRLTAKHADKKQAKLLLDDLEQQINQRVGSYFYGYDETSLSEEVSKLLHANNWTVAAAESLTGGLFSKELTSIPESSSVFYGSVISYTNAVKQSLLHVPAEILNNDGAISAACAEAMAANVRTLIGTDFGISFTGVAGPGESEGKMAGTVFIGVSDKTGTYSRKLSLKGNRETIRMRTVKNGMDILRRHIIKKQKVE